MSELIGLFDGPRARGAFALKVVMRPPWALDVRAGAPLTVIAAVAGAVWLRPPGGAPLRLAPGDAAVTRGPDAYVVAGAPDTPPDIVIGPGQACRDLQGRPLHDRLMHGVRTWGNDPAGETCFLVGAYDRPGEVGGRWLRALPPILTVGAADGPAALLALLQAEVAKDEPGQAAVLDRLLDLLLTALLKAWQQRGAAVPGPGFAARDPVVARALQALHADPFRPWTLAALAREAGAPRAALARRFHTATGEPPMSFLTAWRLALAADLLCDPAQTVASVAGKVGYASPYAFSAAFKRVRGISPSAHRASVQAGAAAADGAPGGVSAPPQPPSGEQV
jgi:AraC-like DNA-binding protein